MIISKLFKIQKKIMDGYSIAKTNENTHTYIHTSQQKKRYSLVKTKNTHTNTHTHTHTQTLNLIAFKLFVMYETKPGIDWQLRPVAAETTVLRSTTATWVFFWKSCI